MGSTIAACYVSCDRVLTSVYTPYLYSCHPLALYPMAIIYMAQKFDVMHSGKALEIQCWTYLLKMHPPVKVKALSN